jgi:hypothetical protein
MVFSAGLTMYNYCRSLREDRILEEHFGNEFVVYRAAVPAMIPLFKRMLLKTRKDAYSVARTNLSHNTPD